MFINRHVVAVVVFLMFNNKSGNHGIPNISPGRLYIMVKFCVFLRTSSIKTQMFLLKKNIFREY